MKIAKGKRLLGVVTALVLSITMLPQMSKEVKAATIPKLTVAGGKTDDSIVFDKNNAPGIESGTATFDAGTNTLTLDNLKCSYDGNAGITSAVIHTKLSSLNIVLVGDNSITNTGSSGSLQGITAADNTVTISSANNGTLTIKTPDSVSNSIGITAGNITIESGTVNVETGTSMAGSICVGAVNSLKINGGSLICKAGSSQGISYGIAAGNTGGGIVEIGANAVVEASGDSGAIMGTVKNSLAGTGWTDKAGTTGETAIAVNTSGAKLDYKKVKFPGVTPKYPDYTPTSDFSSGLGLSTNSVALLEDQQAYVTLPQGTKATVRAKKSKFVKAKYNKKTGVITLTGREAGDTEVTVKVGKKTENIKIKVVAAEFDVDQTPLTLNYKQKTVLTTGVKKNLKLSFNKKIVSAKLNKSKGTIAIQGLAAGNDTVTITYGDIVKKIDVTVTATTTKLSLSKKKGVTFKKLGKSATVGITATPKMSITNEVPTVTVDDTKIATAEPVKQKSTYKIKVTPVAAGTTNMNVKLGTKTATIPITVK